MHARKLRPGRGLRHPTRQKIPHPVSPCRATTCAVSICGPRSRNARRYDVATPWVTESAIVARGLAVVAGGTHALQVVPVQPEPIIALVRGDVVHDGRADDAPLILAVSAERVLGQVERPEDAPACVIAPLTGAQPALVYVTVALTCVLDAVPNNRTAGNPARARGTLGQPRAPRGTREKAPPALTVGVRNWQGLCSSTASCADLLSAVAVGPRLY